MSKIGDVDQFIGNTIKVKRILAKKSLKDVGDTLGITFQQMQKYEKGINRLPCNYLHQISNFLDEPISSFFPKKFDSLHEDHADYKTNKVSELELNNLVKSYSSISNKALRKKILQLIKEMVADQHK